MAVVQIPNLPAAIALTGAEQLEAVQAGSSVRVTATQIAQVATPYILPTGYVTQYQFFSALPLMAPALDANLLFQAIPIDFNSASCVQFYTSAYVGIGSPIYVLCATTYSLNAAQMETLMSLASAQQPWG